MKFFAKVFMVLGIIQMFFSPLSGLIFIIVATLLSTLSNNKEN